MVGVTVSDTPGGLSKVLGLISRAGIDVEYMCSVFGQQQGQACMIFRVADAKGLAAVLKENGLGTIAEKSWACIKDSQRITGFYYNRAQLM